MTSQKYSSCAVVVRCDGSEVPRAVAVWGSPKARSQAPITPRQNLNPEPALTLNPKYLDPTVLLLYNYCTTVLLLYHMYYSASTVLLYYYCTTTTATVLLLYYNMPQAWSIVEGRCRLERKVFKMKCF